MAFEVFMPQLGLTMEEGTVSKWLVKEGDTVYKVDALVEITTDKLTNEVISEYDGVVLKLVAEEEKDYPVKALLAYIGESGETVGEAAADTAATTSTEKSDNGRVAASPYAKKKAKELGVDYREVVGTGPNGRVIYKNVADFAAAAKANTAPERKASPLAKKVAESIGVDLSSVQSHGRVLAQDILAYLESTREKSAETPADTRETVKPMDGMRKAIAKNMLNSHMTSPTVSFNLSVDMSEMKRYREQLKRSDIKVSYTDLLVKFVSKALTEFPLLNCSVDGNNIIYKNYVNMGVAVALDNGLLVPNIQNTDKKSLTEISRELKELASLAREGKLSPDRLRGGTFTITNLGMYGIESFTPIINQPEVAILGVTTMEDRVVVRNGEIVIRPMMTLSLTADHRVVDGSVAAQFMQRIKTLLENPSLLLA